MTNEKEQINDSEPNYDILTSEDTRLRSHVAKASFTRTDVDSNVAFEFNYVYSFTNYYQDAAESFTMANVYKQLVTEMYQQLEIESETLVENLRRPEDFYAEMILFICDKIVEIMNGSPKYVDYLSVDRNIDDKNYLRKVDLVINLLIAPDITIGSDLIWIVTINGSTKVNASDNNFQTVEIENFNSLNH